MNTIGEWIAMQSLALRAKYGRYSGRHPSEDGFEPIDEDFPDLDPIPEERLKMLPMNRADYRRGQRRHLPRQLRKDTFSRRLRQQFNENRKPHE